MPGGGGGATCAHATNHHGFRLWAATDSCNPCLTAWCAAVQASAQQRRGRAGRVRPGLCFRMFSRRQWARMDPHTAPEMLRSPLESVCLTIQAMVTAHRQVSLPCPAGHDHPPAPGSLSACAAHSILACVCLCVCVQILSQGQHSGDAAMSC